MNQPTRYQNQRPPQQPHRRMPQGSMKEQRPEDYAGDNSERTLDQRAGIVARGLIKNAGLEDTTEIWRALKRAYLAGYDEASR